MNLRNVKRNLSLVSIATIVLLFACTKIITTDIGSGLIPPVDGVNTKDTILDVLAFNAGDSLIRSSITDDHVVGYVNDPLFGRTTAKINVQLKPSFLPLTFEAPKASLHLDSVVLVLGYDGIWGDSTQSLALHVYEISNDQNFVADSNYSNQYYVDASHELTQGGQLVNPLTLSDSFHVFQDSGVNQIRIPLDTTFGHLLLNGYDSTTAYGSDSLFNRYIRGFQISAESAGNALLKISLTTNTKLALYYRYDRTDSVGKQDTTVRYFTANSYTSAHSNYIKRDRSGAQIASYYPSRTSSNDDLLFVEAAPGVFSKIQIPGLSGLPNVIIHRAELIADQATDASDQYFTPSNLFLAQYSTDSSRLFAFFSDIYDITQGAISTGSLFNFGISPIQQADATTGALYHTYHFNISRYVQGIVTSKNKNNPLILYAPYNEGIFPSETSPLRVALPLSPFNVAASGRVRLYGGSTLPLSEKPHKMRLHIVYSPL